jgi:HD-like signal output (HDOD) protein
VAIDLFVFYSKCLVPLTPSPAVSKILNVVMTGGETTDDFSQVLALDSELGHWIRLTVQRLGFDRRVTRLDQMVALLGQNRVRDLIIGRNIERAFLKPEQTILGKMMTKMEKDRASDKKGSEPEKEKTAEEADAQEIIPALSEFQTYLDCANRSEDIAVSIRNSYPGSAFAGGVLFDYARYFLKSLEIKELKDKRLARIDDYVEEIFLDGLRCAVASHEIIQKISVPHQKSVFGAAMLHNIGKLLLLAYDPPDFEKSFLASTGESDKKKKLDSSEAEMGQFDFDHAQAGALLLGRLPLFQDIEKSVDYHHRPRLLRYSNPKLYALACLLRVSNALSKLYQQYRGKETDIDRLPDSKITQSPEFQFLKLDPLDWSEIKGNYALKLMKVGL